MHVPSSLVFKPHDRHAHTAITHVIDRQNTAGRAVCARDILSPLDAEGLALLRRSDHRRRQTGKPRFLCGFCQEPVHVRVTSVAASGCVDGRRATFAHDPRPDPRDCPFRSPAKQSSAGEIDAARFNGRQEGARHKHLKARLCQMLAADPRIASADCEVLVTGISADGQAAWRRPDVLAVARDGRRLAFDVQVASPLLTTIDGRERFYSTQGVAWHWIVDADQPDRLHLQGFQDLIMPQACRVLGFNDRIASLSEEDRHSRFHLLHVRETHDRRHLKVRFHTIGLETAFRLAGFPVGPHRCHAVDLRALGFFYAILNKDLSRAGRIFDLLSGAGDTPDWAQARRDHLPGAISTLLSLTSRRTPEAVATTLRNVLPAVKPQHGLSPALLIALSLAVDATRQHRLGHWDGQARAVLDATLRDVAANPAFAQRFRARWSPLLRRLFPLL